MNNALDGKMKELKMKKYIETTDTNDHKNPPFHLWPETATIMGLLAMMDEVTTYGHSPLRENGIRASSSYDTVRRHIAGWFEGEDRDPITGLPHLAHALACLAVLADAVATGKLIDDRRRSNGFRTSLDTLSSDFATLQKRSRNFDGNGPTHTTPPTNDNIDGHTPQQTPSDKDPA